MTNRYACMCNYRAYKNYCSLKIFLLKFLILFILFFYHRSLIYKDKFFAANAVVANYLNRPCRKSRKIMLAIQCTVNLWTYMVREIIGKLAKTACSFFLDARKQRGCLRRRFYYRNGRHPVPRLTRSRLYKRNHSLLRSNFDPLRWKEIWKHY